MTRYSEDRPTKGRTTVGPSSRRPSPKPEPEQLPLSAETIAAIKLVIHEDTGVHQARNQAVTSSVQKILGEWRAKNRKSLMTTSISALVALLGTGGVYGAYNARSDKPIPATEASVAEVVETNAGEMKKRIDANTEAVEGLRKDRKGDRADMRFLAKTIVAIEKHLSAKMNAMSSKARKVEPSPEVQEARDRADSGWSGTRLEDRFEADDD